MATKQKSIAMKSIKSSQIDSIGHDGNTLAVKFKNGGTYHYHGVSATQFSDMQKAESIGGYLHKHIKPKSKFTKI